VDFSRAVLSACAAVLGLLLYLVGGLLLVLAAVNAFRGAAANAPLPETLALAAGFAAAGYCCRLIARKLA